MMQSEILLTAAPAGAATGNDTLLTVLVVLAALILLVGLVTLKKIAALKAQGAPAAAPVPAPHAATAPNVRDDGQVVAAIAAALSVVLERPVSVPGTEAPAGGFVVRRIRRLR